MPITSIQTDPETLTLTAVGEYPVDVERLWKAWADPRQLERFWGPPQWPATFTRHEVREGGGSDYFMTGPGGESSYGYWRFDVVEPQQRFVIRDGFAGPDGTPDPESPESRMEVSFESTAAGSRFVAVSTFASIEAMEKLVSMGMVDGLTAALGQLDDVLEALRQLSADFSAALEVTSDTSVLVRREVKGTIGVVWRAHHEADLVRQWMLGPPGWTMPVCEVGTKVGDTFRYEWENEADGSRFGFVGELLESEPPRRSVTTEQMVGMDSPPTKNELVLTPRPGGSTLIEIRIEYPSQEIRDAVLGSGMLEGMEASYTRLEAVAQLA